MTTTKYARNTSANRKAKREQQYASTLVHYLGVEQALKVCKDKTWPGVRRAIIEMRSAA